MGHREVVRHPGLQQVETRRAPLVRPGSPAVALLGDLRDLRRRRSPTRSAPAARTLTSPCPSGLACCFQRATSTASRDLGWGLNVILRIAGLSGVRDASRDAAPLSLHEVEPRSTRLAADPPPHALLPDVDAGPAMCVVMSDGRFARPANARWLPRAVARADRPGCSR